MSQRKRAWGQVLASIGQLEFFYDQAPDVMRSCSMALQLLSVAAGSYLSGALVWGVSALTQRLGLNRGRGWLPHDLNYGRLDLFFVLLAGWGAGGDICQRVWGGGVCVCWSCMHVLKGGHGEEGDDIGMKGS